jgi:hypothetical protein
MWTTVNAKILAIGFAMHRTHDFHHPRKRMIQYTVTAVKVARPRRTGCPAFAGHDDVGRKLNRREHAPGGSFIDR